MKIVLKHTLSNMNRNLYLAAMLLVGSWASAQHHHDHSKCLTDNIYQMQIKEDPSILDRSRQFEADYRQYLKDNENGTQSLTKVIIPTVFHVFHNGGNEDISKAQILDQIRLLNIDFNSIDLNRLRPEFWGIAATCEIEFRLASIDPSGNCTDGIVRIYDPETENATNNIKLKSVWPTDKYFNVWVVKDINSVASALGTVLGYAQFPWSGSSLTDGIVVRHDNIGSIGTGANPAVGVPQFGRTVTHEVGHWLGLYHPFQDSCFGGDQVDDTPPVVAPNFGNCIYRNSCANDAPSLPRDYPDMVENYMDYADGSCMSAFTIGQKARMMTTLERWRPKLTTSSNLIATGVADPYTPGNCGPTAYFFSRNPRTCANGTVSFVNNTYNFTGTGVTHTWEFPGGNPASSTQATPPAITYAEPGTYNVRLISSQTVAGNVKIDTFEIENYVTVYAPQAQFGAGYVETFEHPVWPVNNWTTYSNSSVNFRHINVGFNSERSMFVRNTAIETGASFYLESPTIDLTSLSNPVLSFQYAFTQNRINNNGTNDGFVVQTSVDCGRSWQNRFNSVGANLATTGGTNPPIVPVNFVPSGAEQWRSVNVALSNISPADRSKVLVRFWFRSAGGNNFYIDNVNFGFALNVSDYYQSETNFGVYPNPSNGETNISLNLHSDANVQMDIIDLFGRNVMQIHNGILAAGEQSFAFNQNANLSKGVYMVRCIVNGEMFVRKFIVN